MKKIIWVICIICCLTVKVLAVDYYVDVNSGSDDNTGVDWSDPFMSITKALQLSRAGDNIYIAPGRYNETISPLLGGLSDKNRIKLIGAGQGVIIDGEGIRACVVNSMQYISLVNLEFTNTFISSSGAVYNSGNYFEIINCKFYNNAISVSSYTGAAFTNRGTVGIKILNCVFYNNLNSIGSNTYLSGGIATYGYRIDTIENCLFYNNAVSGYPTNAPAVCGYVVKFYNNILVKNYFTGNYSTNTSYSCAVKGYYNDSREFVDWDFNCVFGNYNGGSVVPRVGAHDIFEDPLFIDENKFVFYLNENSPLAGMGRPVDGYFTSIGPYGAGKVIDFNNNWDNWKDKDGNNLTNSSYFKINADKSFTLKESVTAELISPVYDFGDEAIFSSLYIAGDLWENLKRGFKQVADVDKILPREFMWRGSEEMFNETNTALPWKKMVFGERNLEKFRYNQLKIVIRKDAE